MSLVKSALQYPTLLTFIVISILYSSMDFLTWHWFQQTAASINYFSCYCASTVIIAPFISDFHLKLIFSIIFE